MMKVHRLLTFALIAVFPALAFAQARPNGDVTVSPFEVPVFNPCTGEDVLVSGTIRSGLHQTFTDSGIHDTNNTIVRASGVGLTSGTEYQIVFHTIFVFEDPLGFTGTFQTHHTFMSVLHFVVPGTGRAGTIRDFIFITDTHGGVRVLDRQGFVEECR